MATSGVSSCHKYCRYCEEIEVEGHVCNLEMVKKNYDNLEKIAKEKVMRIIKSLSKSEEDRWKLIGENRKVVEEKKKLKKKLTEANKRIKELKIKRYELIPK